MGIVLKMKNLSIYQTFLLSFSLIVMSIFVVFQLNDTHNWGDDFAMYLLQSLHFRSGFSLSAKPFIYHTCNPMYAPKLAPPLLPLILAIIPTSQPLSHLLAYKYLLLPFYIGFLLYLFKYIKLQFNFFTSFVIMLIVGLNPIFLTYTNSILTEIPYLCMLFMLLYFMEKKDSNSSLYTIILIFLMILLRTNSIILIPAYFFANRYQSLDNRHFVKVMIVTFFSILFFVFYPSGDSYLRAASFEYSPLTYHHVTEVLGSQFLRHFLAIPEFWNFAFYHSSIHLIVSFLFLGGLCSVLYVTFKKNRFLFYFLAIHLCLILCFPAFQGMRYFLFVFPLVLIFPLHLIYDKWLKTVYLSLLIILLAPTYIQSFLQMEKTHTYTVLDPEVLNLRDFLSKNSNQEVSILSGKARAWALLSNRNSYVFPNPACGMTLVEFGKNMQIDYVITGFYDKEIVRNQIETDTSHFKLVMHENNYNLYQFVH